MVNAFGNKRIPHKERVAKIAERNRHARNPIQGQPPAEKIRVVRALQQINERINYWLQVTEEEPLKWLPYEGTITDSAEGYFYRVKDALESSEVDEDGRIVSLDDMTIRASNRLECATWYTNAFGRNFYLVRFIFSPLPCSTYGRKPLTRSQWKIITNAMIASHCLWGWVHAVREYTEDDSFNVAGITGWHMVRNKFLKKNRGPDLCTGRVIYSQVIEKFSSLNGTGRDGRCRQ